MLLARCALALVIPSLACAGAPVQTYSGAQRPDGEVAVLRQTSRAIVMALNGDAVRGSAWAVLPGAHEVLLRVRIYTEAPNVTWTVWTYCYVPFEAEAGEHYESAVRVSKEPASGLAEKVKMEIGVVDPEGRLVGRAQTCLADRPPLRR